MFSVKECQLFEGVSPSFSILTEHIGCAQNAHGVRKIEFFTRLSLLRTNKKVTLQKYVLDYRLLSLASIKFLASHAYRNCSVSVHKKAFPPKPFVIPSIFFCNRPCLKAVSFRLWSHYPAIVLGLPALPSSALAFE